MVSNGCVDYELVLNGTFTCWIIKLHTRLGFKDWFSGFYHSIYLLLNCKVSFFLRANNRECVFYNQKFIFMFRTISILKFQYFCKYDKWRYVEEQRKIKCVSSNTRYFWLNFQISYLIISFGFDIPITESKF